jgi:hypothetical protein
MRRSRLALIITVLYTVCIIVATIANQQGTDMEGVIWGQVLLAFPWDFVVIRLSPNAWSGPYLYAVCVALNAATLYVIVVWAATRKNSK